MIALLGICISTQTCSSDSRACCWIWAWMNEKPDLVSTCLETRPFDTIYSAYSCMVKPICLLSTALTIRNAYTTMFFSAEVDYIMRVGQVDHCERIHRSEERTTEFQVKSVVFVFSRGGGCYSGELFNTCLLFPDLEWFPCMAEELSLSLKDNIWMIAGALSGVDTPRIFEFHTNWWTPGLQPHHGLRFSAIPRTKTLTICYSLFSGSLQHFIFVFLLSQMLQDWILFLLWYHLQLIPDAQNQIKFTTWKRTTACSRVIC